MIAGRSRTVVRLLVHCRRIASLRAADVSYLVVASVERCEGCQVVLHLGLGQVGQQRLHLLLQLRLRGKDAPLLERRPGTKRAEFWVVGDIEEPLAVLE